MVGETRSWAAESRSLRCARRSQANSPARQYRSFKIRDDIPATSIDKIGIGDLDGDGEYDFVVKRPGGQIDPSFLTRHSPDTFKIEAYKSDGTFLWRRDLGWSIQLGIWFSPFQVATSTATARPRSPSRPARATRATRTDRSLRGRSTSQSGTA